MRATSSSCFEEADRLQRQRGLLRPLRLRWLFFATESDARQPPEEPARGSLTTMYRFAPLSAVYGNLERFGSRKSGSLHPSHPRPGSAGVRPLGNRRVAAGAGRVLVVVGAFLLMGCGVDGASVAGSQAPSVGGDAKPASSAATAESTAPSASVKALRYETVTVIEPIPFPSETVKDAALSKGQAQVTTAGVAGKAQLTYEVEFDDDTETARKLMKKEVIAEPVAQVTTVGARLQPEAPPAQAPQARSCDPNYTGACVPIASDVDCAGGSGNGPAYVRGPVTVVGSDIYGLDRDNNGIGCE